MKRLVLTLTLTLIGVIFHLQAQTTHNFQGGFANNWNIASNWDTGMVPAPGDYAEINTGKTVEITGSETIAYLRTNGSGGVHIMGGGTLTVTGMGLTKPAIENSGGSGHLTNDGTLVVDGAAEEGANFKGTIVNNGTMNFDNCGLHNLRIQGADFTNAAGATVNILHNAGADQDGIAVDDNNGTGGLFTNDGTINITMSGTTGDEGIDITDGSTFVNNGTIDISGGGGDMGMKVRKTDSTFSNNGTFTVDGSADECIIIEEGGIINNNMGGTMDMANSAGHGMDVRDGTFNNADGALYKVISCKDGLFVRADGFVNNDGDMWLDLAQSGEEIELAPGTAGNMVNSATATFHPGSSPGKMEIKHDVDLGASTTTFEIGGTTAITDYDQIVNFGGTAGGSLLTVTGATAVLDWGTYVPNVGDCFTIVDGSGSVAGPWGTITSSNPAIVYTVDYTTDADTEVVICVSAIVPVELASFTGRKTERGAELNWETASEINNENFEIERSADGQLWSKIGQVEGGGNSSTSIRYNFTDESPLDGNNFYRLRQNDFDGNFEYSNTVALSFRNDVIGYTTYPNPVEDVLYIDTDTDLENHEVQLFDANGKMLWSKKGNVRQIPFGNYSPGVYFLNIVSPVNSTIQKIINK